MRLTAKQQGIVDRVQQQGPIDQQHLFEELEGPIENKKIHRSRYNSFKQTLKKLIERGVLEREDEQVHIASPHTQERIKFTQTTLDALEKLRERNAPLTLAHLKKFTDIREWIWSLTEWKLSLPVNEGAPQSSRVIDLDEVLDASLETIEALLDRLNVDADKLMASGLIFGPDHHETLQQKAHAALREKLIRFSLAHATIQSAIQSKRMQQPPSTTIRELIEPVAQLSQEELQQIAMTFEASYLKKAAFQRLAQLRQSHQAYESQLQKRFPAFFTGSWEWDRLYQQLNQKIVHYAKTHGWYQTRDEWNQWLRHHARDRFQHAQHGAAAQPQDSNATFRANSSSQASHVNASAHMPSITTCYQLLGVETQASVDDIRLAFRKLAKAHHPDQGGDPEFFRSLNRAYTQIMQHLGG